jgi:hypothetical protein
MKIILYFDDHAPIPFVGNSWECQLQVANSRHYPGFTDWDDVTDDEAVK